MDCAAARCYNKSREFSVRICNLGKGGGFMETRVLKYFLAVAREENITKAAEQLHITQPTLSRQLAQLEEELGVHLFERGTRRTTLTSEGLLLRRRAEEIVELMDKTERELAEQEELVDGTVSIGWGELESVKFVASMLRAFSEKYPLVRYRLYSANADHLKSQIDRGLLDAGLLLEPADISKYEFVRLGVTERWAAVTLPDDPLAALESVRPNDLRGRRLIIPFRQNVQSELFNWLGGIYDEKNIICVSNMSTNAAIMVRAGFGCMLTIEGSLPYIDHNELAVRPLDGFTSTSVLAWKREQPFSPAVTKFIEFVKCFPGIEKQ